jgi:hypothetical protein
MDVGATSNVLNDLPAADNSVMPLVERFAQPYFNFFLISSQSLTSIAPSVSWNVKAVAL